MTQRAEWIDSTGPAASISAFGRAATARCPATRSQRAEWIDSTGPAASISAFRRVQPRSEPL
eukprot:1160718-Pelagomonas_calceolata.AAC.2